MKEHYIDLGGLTAHGKAQMQFTEGILEIRTTQSITSYTFNLYGDSFKRHHVALPETYCLPFRMDMTVRLDYPLFILLVGDGHIAFGTPRQDNRKLEDIAKPSGKPNQDGGAFDNSLPPQAFVNISVIYNRREMQVSIGGQERLYTRRLPYMRARDFDQRNDHGFELGLVVSKLATLSVKGITVTEYEDDIPLLRGDPAEILPEPGERVKATFDSVTAGLPGELREAVLSMDDYLKSLRPLKFKRAVDKNGGKISYVASDFGLSYALSVLGAQSSQNFGWYIVTNGKPDTWHVRADHMEETLAAIAQSDPALADRIFYALNDCVGCYGSRCLAKRPYAFGGGRRVACHGRVTLRACAADFRDARAFFGYANQVMERKLAAGEPTLEHQLLKK